MNRANGRHGGAPSHDGTGGCVDARKLGAATADRDRTTGFSYVVLADAAPQAPGAGERRSIARQRTKLRSGKIVHPDGQFITECLIHNRSASGCRLRLPAAVVLPSTIHFFDDGSERLFQAVVTWQKHKDVGIRLLPYVLNGPNRAIAERMRRKFYVLPG